MPFRYLNYSFFFIFSCICVNSLGLDKNPIESTDIKTNKRDQGQPSTFFDHTTNVKYLTLGVIVKSTITGSKTNAKSVDDCLNVKLGFLQVFPYNEVFLYHLFLLLILVSFGLSCFYFCSLMLFKAIQ